VLVEDVSVLPLAGAYLHTFLRSVNGHCYLLKRSGPPGITRRSHPTAKYENLATRVNARVAVEDLVELSDVVRRVVRARVRDPHLVEDLTQETLVRVASAGARLAPDARQAYAIVTARNVIVSHARHQSVRDRHAHRLVQYTTLDGPEALTLEREETDALAVGLQQLDAAERDLLLRHESEGEGIESLAVELGTSAGAIAMRLARARATLRLEFLLAFRRVQLPSPRCRQVLLAMSAGDRRRQVALDAAGHLLRCSACSELAHPVTSRRRGIAAWLILPAAEALRRAIRSLRSSRLSQVVAAGAGTIVAVAVVSALRPGTETASAPTPSSTAEPTSTALALFPDTPLVTAAAVTSGATVAEPAAVSPCAEPIALDEVDPVTVLGCAIAPTNLVVTSVPADEGFWAETDAGQVVWVQLVGVGESAAEIVAGTRIVVSGSVAEPLAAGPLASDPVLIDAGFVLEVPFEEVVVR